MFQSNFFTQSLFDEVKTEKYSYEWRKYFNAFSAVSLQGLITEVKGEQRITHPGDMIDCHRNLHTSGFSIKQRKGELKGKVSGYALAVIIKNPEFIVSEASRQRVICKGGHRNVHAYVRGEFVDAYHAIFEFENLKDHIRATYSPFVCGSFFRRDNSKALSDKDKRLYAIAFGSDVFLADF